ncbi:hypothetical protein N7478_011345 [Penicillium angulare]|nr:uncharacterized protein N7478_011345 [Penicillium angulare]KAJ5263740.1 hypothetical protein N7478_011345 [Penicillium angulare]
MFKKKRKRAGAVTGHVVAMPLPQLPAFNSFTSRLSRSPASGPAFHIMAGNSHHPVHIHAARPLYRFTATALGASMWFFLMYRAKKDGPALLGWKHPWDH